MVFSMFSDYVSRRVHDNKNIVIKIYLKSIVNYNLIQKDIVNPKSFDENSKYYLSLSKNAKLMLARSNYYEKLSKDNWRLFFRSKKNLEMLLKIM